MKWYMHWIELRFALVLIGLCAVLYMIIFSLAGNTVEPGTAPEQLKYNMAKWILGSGFGTGWMVATFCGTGLRSAWAERRLDGMVLPLTLPVSRTAVITSRLLFNSIISLLVILVVLALMPVWHDEGLSVFDTTLTLVQLVQLFAWSVLIATGTMILGMLLVLALKLPWFWAAWFVVLILPVPYLVKEIAATVAYADLSWWTLLLAIVAVLLASRLPSVVADKVEYAG